jgi:ubiquinol-cytochrome c reductase iron-sulfur subunit
MSSRRDFMGMALGGFAALGGIAALYAAKKTWDKLPSVEAAGFTTIDLSAAQENQLVVEKWRGKPIFVLKKSASMPKNDRDIIVNGNRYLIAIGLCTHLGCIPTYLPGDLKFKCPCHGGEFDASGIETFGPPPSPLVIPPFKIQGNSILLGEEGPEYTKMKASGIIG